MGRKQQTMVPPTVQGGGLLPKLVGGLVVLGVLVLVIKHPSEAAGMATGIGHFIGSAIDGVAAFIRNLA